jgi:hypothetical protein
MVPARALGPGPSIPTEIRITTGPWDVILQAAADALLEQLRARIRSKEAEQAHQRSMQETRVQADLREQGAQADFERSLRAEEFAAGVRVWEQVSVREEELRQKASPFKLPVQDIRVIAKSVTHDGAIPALILAPFLDRLRGSVGIDVCRQLWWRAQEKADWTESLVGLSGHMRPVSDLDLDIELIRAALDPLPFVLVHGDVESDHVQIRIVGLGVMPQRAVSTAGHDEPVASPAVSICGTFPRPNGPAGSHLAGDMIDTVLACAGALGEVFHLVRSRRLPRLHTRVPEWLQPGVTAMIIGGYGIAMENAKWDVEIVKGLQDLVSSMPEQDKYGLRRKADELLNDVMQDIVMRGLEG